MHKLLTKRAKPFERVSFTAEFSDLSPGQAEQFKRLFACMNTLGNWGSSRLLQVNYDGDGAARGVIKIDGKSIELDQRDRDAIESGSDKLKFSFD